MNDFDPALLEQITREAESRNRDFDAQGRPIRSSAGALYGMQVLPSTARDPGFGVKPARSQTPAEYNRVGLDLLQSFIRRYGDPRTAWAAYNWGPGKVEKTQGRYGPNWFAHAPAGVRAYANSNVAKLGVQQRAPTPSAQPGTAAMEDEYLASAPDEGFGGLSRDAWWQDYRQTQRDAMKLEADAAAQRKQQYEAGLAALQQRQWGPSSSEKLAAWSAALLAPTRVRGFKGTLMNLAPVVREMTSQGVAAKQQRADALRALQDKYASGQIEDRRAMLEARRENLKTAAPLLKSSSGNPVWSEGLKRFIPRDEPTIVGKGVLNGQQVFKYSDGTARIPNADGTVNVYNAGGQLIGTMKGSQK